MPLPRDKFMNAEEILVYIIDLFTCYLDELNDLPRNDFIHGEMTAFAETLEIIQGWSNSKSHNLNFIIAEKYNI